VPKSQLELSFVRFKYSVMLTLPRKMLHRLWLTHKHQTFQLSMSVNVTVAQLTEPESDQVFSHVS